jgi:hypothetical protein
MPRFRVDEFKLGHYHGPVHIAVHGGPRYHQDDALRPSSGERRPHTLCPASGSSQWEASGEKRGAKKW